jgi:putative oxidoreductase
VSTHANHPEDTGGDGGDGLFFAGGPTNRLGSGPESEPGFDSVGFSPIEPEPGATTVVPAVAGGEPGFADVDVDRWSPRWHGGADFGLLVLRLVVGGTLVAHGLQHLFGLLGGMGIHDYAVFLTHHGYQHDTAMAWLAGGTELGAGGLLVLGLFTPLAAAGALGVLSQAILVTWRVGFFTGFELPVVIAGGAFALLFAGPGRVALDRPTPWYRHPVAFGWIFLVIAAAVSAAVWFTMRTSAALPAA